MSKDDDSLHYGGISLVLKCGARIVEFKYSIEEEYRGNGFISESLKVVVSWIFNNTSVEPIEADYINIISEHIVRDKLGFVFYKINEECKDYKWYRLERSH